MGDRLDHSSFLAVPEKLAFPLDSKARALYAMNVAIAKTKLLPAAAKAKLAGITEEVLDMYRAGVSQKEIARYIREHHI